MKTKINWIVRVRNKAFWLALVPAMLLLVQQIASLFGLDYDYSQLDSQITEIINTVFVLLAILGIVIDPTTQGIQDSSRAITYRRPAEEDHDA